MAQNVPAKNLLVVHETPYCARVEVVVYLFRVEKVPKWRSVSDSEERRYE